MEDLVSVVVPIYNQEAYLHRSLTSIINQSYPYIEIIAVNDGSTDSSLTIIQKFQEKDNRIKIINQCNSGLVAAVTVGVKMAKGNYICFVDPDDYISEDFIQTFVKQIGNNDCIACGFYRDANGIISENRLADDLSFCNSDIIKLKDNFLLDSRRMQVSNVLFVSRWNKMYSATCVRKIIDLYYECKAISLGEDTIFTYLILTQCKNIVTRSQPNGYYYNIRSANSMMSNGTVEGHLKKSCACYEKFYDILKNTEGNSNNALYLYFFLIETLFQRCKKEKDYYKEFCCLFRKLQQDEIYKKALTSIIRVSRGKKRLGFYLRKYITSPRIFYLVSRCFL